MLLDLNKPIKALVDRCAQAYSLLFWNAETVANHCRENNDYGWDPYTYSVPVLRSVKFIWCGYTGMTMFLYRLLRRRRRIQLFSRDNFRTALDFIHFGRIDGPDL